MCIDTGQMETANHINIPMTEEFGTNGSSINHKKLTCGSTLSFHHIQYEVLMKSNLFRWKSPSTKKILADLRSVSYLQFSALLLLWSIRISLNFQQ